MKTTKLVIGIVSIVLTGLIVLQSCTAALGDALIDEGGTSGGAGMLVAIMMLVAGIVSIAARSSRGGGIFCMVLYALAGVIGLTMHGIYGDLMVWGSLCILFAVLYLIFTLKTKKAPAAAVDSKEEQK